MSDRDMRAYLLGQASDQEIEKLEVRLLDDQEVFETLRGVEDDLFDEYARGRMSAAERERFVERFGDQRGRLLVAHAWVAQTPAPRVLAFRRIVPRWASAAAAALLVAAVGITAWMRTRPADPRSPARVLLDEAVPAPAVLIITLGSSRSGAAVPEVLIRPDVPTLELRVRLNPADRFDAYSMELRSTSGVLVWRADNLRATPERGDLLVIGAVPASALTDPSYELSVRGSVAGAAEEALGYAPLSVRR